MAPNSRTPTYDPATGTAPEIPDVNGVLRAAAFDVRSEVDPDDAGVDIHDAVTHAVETNAPIHEWTCGQHAYVLAYLFTYVGQDPQYVLEETRSAGTWHDLTGRMVQCALHDTVTAFANRSLQLEYLNNLEGQQPKAIVVDDTRCRPPREQTIIHEDWRSELHPEVHQLTDAEWPSRLHDTIQTLATRVEQTMAETDQSQGTAIMDVLEETDVLWTGNPVEYGIYFDAFEDLYGMDGGMSIVSEQLTESHYGAGWAGVMESGVLYHAIRGAVEHVLDADDNPPNPLA